MTMLARTFSLDSPAPMIRVLGLGLCLLGIGGCGTTQSYTATEQLLMSDAVDATVSKIDFSPLRNRKTYLDATYLKTQKSAHLVDADYVISSLRQQMVAAGVHLVEGRDEADLIAEARLGALGLDGHNVTYGLPANSALSTASSVLTNAPLLPSLPEVSLARREAKSGAAKIAVFAYRRETREPYWQSGIARSTSNARDTWLFGVGPLQSGSIYDETRFAGSEVASRMRLTRGARDEGERAALNRYQGGRLFEAAIKDNIPSFSGEQQLASVEDGSEPSQTSEETDAGDSLISIAKPTESMESAEGAGNTELQQSSPAVETAKRTGKQLSKRR